MRYYVPADASDAAWAAYVREVLAEEAWPPQYADTGHFVVSGPTTPSAVLSALGGELDGPRAAAFERAVFALIEEWDRPTVSKLAWARFTHAPEVYERLLALVVAHADELRADRGLYGFLQKLFEIRPDDARAREIVRRELARPWRDRYMVMLAAELDTSWLAEHLTSIVDPDQDGFVLAAWRRAPAAHERALLDAIAEAGRPYAEGLVRAAMRLPPESRGAIVARLEAHPEISLAVRAHERGLLSSPPYEPTRPTDWHTVVRMAAGFELASLAEPTLAAIDLLIGAEGSVASEYDAAAALLRDGDLNPFGAALSSALRAARLAGEWDVPRQAAARATLATLATVGHYARGASAGTYTREDAATWLRDRVPHAAILHADELPRAVAPPEVCARHCDRCGAASFEQSGQCVACGSFSTAPAHGLRGARA